MNTQVVLYLVDTALVGVFDPMELPGVLAMGVGEEHRKLIQSVEGNNIE